MLRTVSSSEELGNQQGRPESALRVSLPVLKIHAETADQVNDWRNLTEDQVDTLLDKTTKEILERKVSVQSGFQKMNYTHFNQEILNYKEFKRRWDMEVFPERKPEQLELAALKESESTLVKNKLSDCITLQEAWNIQDHNIGDLEEIRAKLKQHILHIKIKATDPNQRIIELYNSVQNITAKIHAAGSLDLLEADI